ncbi:HAAS signaling domain-containing protein [Oceanobacillus caeni]|uniref:HAAS signaling domain-containing protein n=1 Tax=Oceanobacillus caeni TaxID=405946 RepID=UPI00195AB865
METIDRYIYAVTQKLPQAQRKDIADELRGLIEDMLEERVGIANIKESDVEDVLLELGSPNELAEKYRGTKKYLIGPELFDSYILVLKIVLIVVSAGIGIGFLIQTILDPISILDYFIDMIVSLVTSLPMAFGWTTFSFAIGERSGEVKRKDLIGQEWKPSDLPPIPDEKRQIKRGESIAGIIFYAIFIAFLAFSSDYFGIWVFQDEFTGVVPFLNEQTYGSYLMFIILLFGFGILKECLKLVSGKWTYKLAIVTIIVNAVSMAAIVFIINGPDFWNPEFMNELAEAGVVTVGSEAFDIVNKVWDQLTFWIIILLVIGLVWDAVDGFIKARKK